MIAQTLAVSFAMAAAIGAAGRAMSLASADLKPNARIPDAHVFNGFGCTGKNLSPELSWSGAPDGAKSFAVVCHDPDAPGRGGFWHWLIFDIPANVARLPLGAGDPKSGAAPKGATQSRNDFGAAGYGGPCPPRGDKPHRYRFTVFALDVDRLGADANASPAEVASRLDSHALAKATLTGLWGR
jgi:hypothetical protein